MDRRAESGRIHGAFHMKMTAMFHIALLPDANESAFTQRMTESVFKDLAVFALTRTTAAFAHQLLKKQSRIPAYVWQATVDLVTDHEYDFEGNVDRVRAAIKGMGVVTSVEVYTHLGASA
jgi:hypothetical protein